MTTEPLTSAHGVYVPRQTLIGPVTGTKYPNARVLGRLRDRAPNHNELLWLDAVVDVQAAMPDLLPLTPRTYAYRISGRPGFTKEIATKGIVDFLSLARRCGWIGWDTVDDSRTRTINVPSDLTPVALDERLVDVAQSWTRWPRLGQTWAPEIWVEAVGSMASVVEPARRFGASIVSSGGTNSLSEIFKLVDRVVDRWNHHAMQTIVMLIGDYDDQGRARLDRAIAEAWALLRDDCGIDTDAAAYLLAFEWVAVTPEQIDEWDLAASDANGTKYEVEAVDPVQLQDHLSEALKGYTHTKLLARVLEASRREGQFRAERLNGHPAAARAVGQNSDGEQ
jgi:hypothetical protein